MADRIIFLDIDGVLNSERWYRGRAPAMHEAKADHIDPAGVGLVNQLIVRTDAKVVISSTWRHFGEDFVKGVLVSRGFIGEIIGITPPLGYPRGREIQAWIDDAPVPPLSLVILDDNSDMLHLKSRLVLTKSKTGITLNDVDRAVRILNTPCGLLTVKNPKEEWQQWLKD